MQTATNSDESPPVPSWLDLHFRLAGWLASAAIALAVGMAYRNSVMGPFVFDDQGSIVENASIRRLWPFWTALSPPGHGTTVSGRPFLNLSFAFNYSISGLHVLGYHLVNIIIHALAGIALFGILRRTLIASTPEASGESAARSARIWAVSLASALIWAVHPLLTESVTYVAQRAEALMGLLYLSMLYCFLRGAAVGDRETGPNHRPSVSALDRPPSGRIWYVLAVAMCALGMATKEVMATAPIVVLLYDRTFAAGSVRAALRARWPVYLGFACCWIELAFLVAANGGRGGTAGFGTSVPWSGYALRQLEAILAYLRLSIWPHALVFDYGHTLPVTVEGVAMGAAALLAIMIATAIGWVRRSPWGFLGAWFLLILAPSSSVVPVATEIMAEHRMYLPLAAIAVGVGAGLHRILGSGSRYAFAVLIVVLGVATFHRNQIYGSRLLLWGDTVKKMPGNAGAHNNLGTAFLDLEDIPSAIEQFTEAVRLDSESEGARSNLGNALFRAGRFPEAVACFKEVLRRLPYFVEGQKNLGMALASEGKPNEAMVQFEQVLKVRPDDGDVRGRLGCAMLQAGLTGEAVPQLEKAVRIAPDNLRAQAALADALLETGQPEAAIVHYAASIRLSPGLTEAWVNLGSAQLLAGHPLDAIDSFKTALRLRPNDAKIGKNLAIALRAAHRPGPAQSEFAPINRLAGKAK